jgi:hypothetical protein
MESSATVLSSVSTSAIIHIDASKIVEIMPAILASVPENKVVEATASVDESLAEKREDEKEKEKVEVAKLTEEQEELLKAVYEKAKSASETIINEPSINNSVKVAQIVGQTIKLLEEVTNTGKKLVGKDKKIVAMELCRRTIKELIKDEGLKLNILNKFDTIGEQMLETMIDVSKHLNITVETIEEVKNQVEQVAVSSCSFLKPLFSKK